jgi:ribosomal-protein-alanine N-acetyltransferase
MSAVIETPPFFLRPMGKSDLDTIMAIESTVYGFPWTRQIFADCLRVGYCCRVCEMDAHIVGYSVMSMGASEAHILNVSVKHEYQRRGLGYNLLQHMLSIALKHNVHTVFLEVRPSNTAALALYDKLGFNQIGIRRDYYPSLKGREDAVILALTLQT